MKIDCDIPGIKVFSLKRNFPFIIRRSARKKAKGKIMKIER